MLETIFQIVFFKNKTIITQMLYIYLKFYKFLCPKVWLSTYIVN